MVLLRIRRVQPLGGHRLRLTLMDSTTVERVVSGLLVGPVFEPVLRDTELFSQVRVERGMLVWPGGVDLCPDVLIWGGVQPRESRGEPSGSDQERSTRVAQVLAGRGHFTHGSHATHTIPNQFRPLAP